MEDQRRLHVQGHLGSYLGCGRYNFRQSKVCSNASLARWSVPLEVLDVFLDWVYEVSDCSGGVAQLGERLVRNQKVSGSIPLISTISFSLCAPKISSKRCLSSSKYSLDQERPSSSYHPYKQYSWQDVVPKAEFSNTNAKLS